MGNSLRLHKPVSVHCSVHVLVEIFVCLDYKLDQKNILFRLNSLFSEHSRLKHFSPGDGFETWNTSRNRSETNFDWVEILIVEYIAVILNRPSFFWRYCDFEIKFWPLIRVKSHTWAQRLLSH